MAPHCRDPTTGDRKFLQFFQPSSGLRGGRDPAPIFGFSTSVGRRSRAISSAAPQLQGFASSTTTHYGTSASRVPRSKRRSTASSRRPSGRGYNDGLLDCALRRDRPARARSRARGGGFSIVGIPLLSIVMDPVTAGGLLALYQPSAGIWCSTIRSHREGASQQGDAEDEGCLASRAWTHGLAVRARA